MKTKWTRETAIAALVRNKYKVDDLGKTIEAYGAGLKLLGAVDYLVKYHWFTSLGRVR